MSVLVLNRDLEAIAVVDEYTSLIWTERYFKCGDFEISVPIDDVNIDTFKEDCYLWREDSEYVMIIEGRQIITDTETGVQFLISGRSLESILDRRIIWNETTLTGSLQLGIKKLLDENIINPTDETRKINNFIFKMSDDPSITELTTECTFKGDNLYDAIEVFCEVYEIGFRVKLTDDNMFEFELYSGKNRSFGQEVNPYVIFSPRFENLLNSNYIESKKNFKTIALIDGDTVRTDFKIASYSGLDRRETYVEAISSDDISQLEQLGENELAEQIFTKMFDGEAETTTMFKYGEDFTMGDILQLVNEYDMEAQVRVIELIRSENSEGFSTYPTFQTIRNESVMPDYTGPYAVEPEAYSEVELSTKNTVLSNDITVNKIKYETTGEIISGQTATIADK